ncbi:MAG: protein phosphatase 2C domain-containing protein [Thiohalophilus sp.]|uniref:PP2C family protein-serine/threonine phosphatase n=1 Tax=Thiohalophilus sp. TaxID=3028392 RepID=UPI0028707CED|nr:protein phosphatase 2C domain-containing protein [Thiohalophilus sp.]MDR9435623.1 protein phosphatase 2C domain-containing protein [Thiohalophilus sp.]
MALSGGQVVFYTHRAPNKETVNEDSMGLVELDSGSCVLIVADGLGGQPAGATASEIAVQTLSRSLQRTDATPRETILQGFDRANHQIIEHGSGSATTLAVVEIRNNQLRPYHVGDSMIVVTGQRGKQKLFTVSHSPVGYAVEAGLLNEEEAITHAQRHLISNVVGADDMNISMGSLINLAPRDTLLLASDGLFDNLYYEEIIAIIRKGSLSGAAARLVELAHQRMAGKDTEQPCHPDDLSFILYRPLN